MAPVSDPPIVQRGFSFTSGARCRLCGAVEEAALPGRGATCQKCSQGRAGVASLARASLASFDYGAARFRRTSEALARLTKGGPGPDVLGVVVEILALHNRVTSLGAFVPLLGPWLVARSDAAPDRKFKLQCVSAGLTALTIVSILALLRSFSAPSAPLRERLRSQIQTLGEIAQEFRAEHGSYPDAETWQRTAEQPDLRFFDPWLRAYRYERTEDGGVTIGTLGRDGVEGGTDEDADVSVHVTPPEPATSNE